MTIRLPEGSYPFVTERHDLANMAMVEAAPALEAFFRQQAAANGVELIRDKPFELKCGLEDETIATFLIWYPTGQDRIHMLVPKEHVTGRA
jgi:hypothetical protein